MRILKVVGNGGTTMALQKKRSRRVSFAEMTSVHFFDRDDEFNETPRTDTAKPSDNLGNDLGFDGQLEEPRDSEGGNDDDNDEEMVMRSSFLHPVESPSPGSTIGSATSNDACFIRPGQLSDSAALDDNHDVTMDSTALSMHFHSLARSESGVELKTPTGVHLSFEEKTETNENVGSFIKLTLVKKPIFESSIVATNASGSHDSNDMSLVGENPSKYNYERLSPALFVLLEESRNKLLAVGASDDTNASQSPGRLKSRLSVPYDGNSLVDLSEFAKQEIGTIISHDLLSKEVSDVHGKFQEANGGTGTSPTCHPPQGFSFNPSNAAAFDISKDNQNRSLNQLSKIWVVHSVESMNGQQNVVLDYLDFAVQSLKVTMGPASTIKISFRLNDGNIIKNFRTMDACSAFEFVFDVDIRRKYAGVGTLVTEIQVTSSLLGTLLDVLEEVQLAQLELPNLNQSSFYGLSVEQLHLQLCFIKFISGRKVTLTLDMSCLERNLSFRGPSIAFIVVS